MLALKLTSTEGGTFDAFVFEPPGGGPAPALVVVSSIMGITDGLKRTMERYASKGYYVIAADPFWRTAPGPLDHSRMDEAVARLHAWRAEEGVSDMKVALSVLETLPGWNRKWAVVGFCFGGEHAMIALSRLGADAAVAFHGVRMELYLDQAAKITKPFSFHFAEFDGVVPLATVDAVRKGLAGKNGEIFVYDGAHHGFAQEESQNYHPTAATQSEDRAFAILAGLK